MKQSLFDFAKLLYSDEIIKKSDDISILLTYWLLVVGCWLLVDGCWLTVVGCLENKISTSQLSKAINSPSVPTAVGKCKISIEKNR